MPREPTFPFWFSGQVTWKHPFYDYFRQLRDFCRQASREEVMQVGFEKSTKRDIGVFLERSVSL